MQIKKMPMLIILKVSNYTVVIKFISTKLLMVKNNHVKMIIRTNNILPPFKPTQCLLQEREFSNGVNTFSLQMSILTKIKLMLV
jgi:hypothetical protein